MKHTKDRIPLFSITRDDFNWTYYKGSGAGGQHKNKVANCVRCIHKESGAMATAEDYRELGRNKKLAFEKCCNSKKFQVWLKMQIAHRCGEKTLEEEVEEMMQARNLKIEFKNDEGKWEVFNE